MDENKNLIKNAGVIEDFLLNFKSSSTKRSYRSHLNTYFKTISVEQPDDYFNDNRNYEMDVKQFAQTLQNRPPLTQKTILACIRSFLAENEVDLKLKTWRRLNHRIQGRKPVTENVAPTTEQLKKILNHADIKGKALFSLIATSGMRITETVNLTFDDIDRKNRIIRISGTLTKNGDKCITFFTEEAKKYLEDWLKIRDKFLEQSFYKSKYVRKMFAKKGIVFKKVGTKNNNNVWEITKDGKTISNKDLIKEENRIFPFSNINAERIWCNLLEKSGLNEKETDSRLKHPRYKLHIHTLRKFFSTKLEDMKVPQSYIDQYTNHTERYNGSYTLHTIEQLKKVYDNYSSCLNIFAQETIVVNETEIVKQQRKQIEELQEQVEILMGHYKELTGTP